MLDVSKVGAKDSHDIAVVLLGVGTGGLADAFFDVAPFSDPMASGMLMGLFVLSLFQIFVSPLIKRRKYRRIVSLKGKAAEARDKAEYRKAEELDLEIRDLLTELGH